jgi:glycosyltransferase involved in cell wall biosynthesis
LAGEMKDRRRVLVLETGAGFGGSVVCLAKLVRTMEASGFEMLAGIMHAEETSSAFLSREGVRATHVRCYRRPAGVNNVLSRIGRQSRPAKAALLATLLTVEKLLARRGMKTVERLIRRSAPDLFALNNGWNGELGGLAGRLGLGRRTLVHGRGMWPKGRPVRLADHPFLAAMSHAVASSYIDAGWPADRVAVVYDHFEIPAPPPPPSDWRGLTNNRTTVALVGSLEAWKGHSVFIDAAATLSPRYPEVQFLIVGGETLAEPAYPAVLSARIRDLGLQDSVRITGWRSDVKAIVAAVDIVVHASIEPEPFGNVVPEAMSLGKPVIAADAGGPREVIRHGIDGLLCSPGSIEELVASVACLLDNGQLRRDLGTTARERVRDLLSETRFADGMRAIYERALGY